ncbi:MAG: glutamyl-tRNA synthetase [Edafosvirus sp.]|uniref:Glutamyl-tRNA synthetase n=1 Tax=Edafosvirus sp. TaxID=2487765 RepID=A0A3G4ZZD0_9VIRU|nr:MAG: glutamyl-tRNA synthetase [Edafosvirus sp.]
MNFNWTIPGKIKKILDKHKDQIVVRFPPEPSGYLHIGHVKALCLNYVVAWLYKGRLIIRMDDTNPSLESDEYEKAIMEDINKLEIKYDKYSHTSDYFDQILKCADTLVENGLAYVDDTEKELLKKQRDIGEESKNRNFDIKTCQEMWNKMKTGEITNACLRIKMDMNHDNKALRDPTIFRYVDHIHHQTKDKYKVYPTYDFACPIVDVLEGVTHVFRSTEFSDRDDQYNIILDKLKMKKPELFQYGKINIKGVDLSKRKIKKAIEEKTISGWDDPTLYTLRGAMKKGLCLEALSEFVQTSGFSKAIVNMEPTSLWGLNRKIIDKKATRYIVISSTNNTIINISESLENKSDVFSKDIFKFDKIPALGTRKIHYDNQIYISENDFKKLEKDEEITLINWGNMIYSADHTFTKNLQGDVRKTSKKIYFLDWISYLIY